MAAWLRARMLNTPPKQCPYAQVPKVRIKACKKFLFGAVLPRHMHGWQTPVMTPIGASLLSQGKSLRISTASSTNHRQLGSHRDEKKWLNIALKCLSRNPCGFSKVYSTTNSWYHLQSCDTPCWRGGEVWGGNHLLSPTPWLSPNRHILLRGYHLYYGTIYKPLHGSCSIGP